MPGLRYGDMFREAADLTLVTANSTLTRDGRLVMGRGAAKELKEKLPGIDVYFGHEIAQTCGSLGFYGLIVHPQNNIGIFQVKYHWRSKATLGLIEASVYKMCDWLAENPGKMISMNFPGVGNGGLNAVDVWPALAPLSSDRVTIWEK